MSPSHLPAGTVPVPCQGCRKPVVFAVAPSGKKIPLDTVAPTYRVTEGPDGRLVAERTPDVLVSHFTTCPQAAQFSRRAERKTAVP